MVRGPRIRRVDGYVLFVIVLLVLAIVLSLVGN
jgi:hypothetical protein